MAPIKNVRLCMYEDGYSAEAGKRKCKWHLLLKVPMEDQILEAHRRGDPGPNSEYVPVQRVPKDQWPDGERWCSKCQAFVPLFYTTGSQCKAHAAEASHNTRIQAEYGIDRTVYLALLELQGGRCYVCRQLPKTKRLAVDHDHKTNEVRGLLCADVERGCNHAVLGSLEARSVDGVIAAAYRLIEYMTKTPYQRLQEAANAESPSPSDIRYQADREDRDDAGEDRPGAVEEAPTDRPGDESGGAESLPEPGGADESVRYRLDEWASDPVWANLAGPVRG